MRGFCFVVSLLLFALSARAQAENLIVFPDSFRMQESDGSPLISVRETADEIVATLSMEVSYAAIYSQLRSVYGDSFEDLDLTQVSVLPEHFDAMSEFFSRSNVAFKRIESTFDVNKAKVRFYFNKDYSIAQIRESLLFPISLGTLDARIVCLGTASFDRCGQIVKRLPLLNQFSTSIQDGQALQYSHLVFLRNYAANLVLTSEAFLSESFSQIVRQQYFANGNCTAVSRKWDRSACETVRLYSGSFSIREAVLGLTQNIYPATALVDNLEYFVFAGSRLNLKEINLALDFEAIRQQINQNFTLTLNDGAQNPFPLIKEAKATTQLHFILEPNVLFWEGQDLRLNLARHLEGTTNIQLKPVFGGQAYTIPVTFKISFSLKYNPLTEALAVESLTVEDLEFLAFSGIGYEFAQANKSRIQELVIGYINSPKSKASFDAKVREVLRSAQEAGIGFNLIKQE